MSEHKDHADVKIHPPLLMMVHVAVGFLGEFLFVSLDVPNLLQQFGFGLVVLGFVIGGVAFVALRKAGTTVVPHGKVSVIVMDGVYRFSRNPIYLGFVLILVGLLLDVGSYWGVILAPVFVISMNSLVIEKEEAYLEKKFKDVYTSYKSRVRRWV